MTAVEFFGEVFLKIRVCFFAEYFFIHVAVLTEMYILAEMAVWPVEKQK